MARPYMALIALIVVVLAFIAGYGWRSVQPVCHSVTEDSVITDCDYRDGGWYQK